MYESLLSQATFLNLCSSKHKLVVSSQVTVVLATIYVITAVFVIYIVKHCEIKKISL